MQKSPRPKNFHCLSCNFQAADLLRITRHLRARHESAATKGETYIYTGKHLQPNPSISLDLSHFQEKFNRHRGQPSLDETSTRCCEEIFKFLRALVRKKPTRCVPLPTDAPRLMLFDILRSRGNTVQTVSGGDQTFVHGEQLDNTLSQLCEYQSSDLPTSIWAIPAAHGGLLEWATSTGIRLQNAFSVRLTGPYTTTLSTPKQISTWHFDRTDSGTLLVELFGDKLFIAFPPTVHNLNVFRINDRFPSLEKSVEILKNLEDVYFFTLGPGDAFLLGPGHGHMVLSATKAAVGGWPCMKAGWEGDIQRLVDQELDIQGRQQTDTGRNKQISHRKRGAS